MKTIKYILLLLPFIGMGQNEESDLDNIVEHVGNYQFIELKYQTVKERQYQYVYSTIYLMDLYMQDIASQNIVCIGCPGEQPRKTIPSFEDFYNWTKKYFKDEKDSFRVVIEQ